MATDEQIKNRLCEFECSPTNDWNNEEVRQSIKALYDGYKRNLYPGMPKEGAEMLRLRLSDIEDLYDGITRYDALGRQEIYHDGKWWPV